MHAWARFDQDRARLFFARSRHGARDAMAAPWLDDRAQPDEVRRMAAAVRSAHVRAHLPGLEAVGLPAEILAQRRGIDPAVLDDAEHWVRASRVHALWEAGSALDPAPDLGLRVGPSVSARDASGAAAQRRRDAS